MHTTTRSTTRALATRALATRALATLALATLAACGGGSQIEVAGDTVRVQTDQLQVTFTRADPIDDTYMVFGGMATDRSDMTSKATIVGLSMTDARPIHAEYPDFHRCSSGGAQLAQKATRQMDIVPATGAVLAGLQDALARHKASLGNGGERVCVKLSGCVLKMSSAMAGGQEVLSQLPGPVRRDHYLVESVELVPATDALQRP